MLPKKPWKTGSTSQIFKTSRPATDMEYDEKAQTNMYC